MCCGKEARRTILWMCWVVNMLITSIYYILSFCTTANLVRALKELSTQKDVQLDLAVWRSPMAAAVLGGLLVLLFNFLSCAILIRKSIEKRGPGLGYGFVCAFCFCLAFFCLLCGLVLDGFQDTVKSELEGKLAGAWSKYNTGQFQGTIAFAYICFVMFQLFFWALVMFQSGVSEELGLPPAVQANPYARMQEGMYGQHMGLQDPNLMIMAPMMGHPGMMMGGPGMMPPGYMASGNSMSMAKFNMPPHMASPQPPEGSIPAVHPSDQV